MSRNGARTFACVEGVEVGDGRLLDRARAVDPVAVHEHVEPAEAPEALVHRAARRVVRRQVGDDDFGLLRLDFLERLAPPPNQRYPRASRVECLRDRAADPAPGPGDERGSPGETGRVAHGRWF